jgi:hypothetical protein
MPMKRYKPEQIVALLRQIEVEIAFWPASVRQPLRGVAAETLRDSRDLPRS